ncbi:hypothetical protein L1887_50840 [Cichorium endivia]|nr:hypothetical protein L1887_50840 [Cichorium endivia]
MRVCSLARLRESSEPLVTGLPTLSLKTLDRGLCVMFAALVQELERASRHEQRRPLCTGRRAVRMRSLRGVKRVLVDFVCWGEARNREAVGGPSGVEGRGRGEGGGGGDHHRVPRCDGGRDGVGGDARGGTARSDVLRYSLGCIRGPDARVGAWFEAGLPQAAGALRAHDTAIGAGGAGPTGACG